MKACYWQKGRFKDEPGAFIKRLSHENREIINKLKSNSIKEVMKECFFHAPYETEQERMSKLKKEFDKKLGV